MKTNQRSEDFSGIRTGRSALAAAFAFAAVAGSNVPAQAKPCPPHKVYGLIGARYAQLHGSDGPLGCPVTDEADVPGGGGRYNRFENGAIVFSPSTGPKSVQSAYVQSSGSGMSLVVDWGDTSPFNYDFFNVRWDRNGSNLGQQSVRGPRTSGHFQIPIRDTGYYQILVEGCDHPVPFSSSRCRQGWSRPLLLDVYRSPPPRPSPPASPAAACAVSAIKSVTPSGSASSASFDVEGCGFRGNSGVRVRFVDDALGERDARGRSDPTGKLSLKAAVACAKGTPIHVSATDGTTSHTDLTGFVWSNTFNTRCP